MLIADYSSAAISIFSGSMKLLSSSVCDVQCTCTIFPDMTVIKVAIIWQQSFNIVKVF